MKRVEQSRLGAVIGQSGSNQDILVKALIRSAVDLARSLVGEEIEDTVLANWASQGSAKDVAAEHRSSLACGLQVGIVGVQRVVTKILIHAAMKQVGAALGGDLHVAAARAGDRRVIQRRLHHHLAN